MLRPTSRTSVCAQMGSFLDKPITEKESEVEDGNGLRSGASAMQGWRVTMEDSHTMIASIEGLDDHGFYAVYDGHGGDKVAKIAGTQMIGKLLATQEWKGYCAMDDKTTDAAADQVGKAMRRAFLDLDAEMKELPQMKSGEDQSGCTAIAAIISPTFTVVANAGDSRSIMGKGGGMIPMSFDHKPYNEGETRRIEAAGGCVSMKRVNGDLAVSRALGDFNYKQSDDLPPEAQQVSAEADITVERRDGSEEFLVIACDGIWDVMSNEDACEYVRQNLQRFETADTRISQATDDLIDTCLKKGSRDNMSAVIVCFGGAKIATEPTKWEAILPEDDEDVDAGGGAR